MANQEATITLRFVDQASSSLSKTVSNIEHSLSSLTSKSINFGKSVGNFFGNAIGSVTGFFSSLTQQASIASAVLSGTFLNSVQQAIGAVADFERFNVAIKFFLKTEEAAIKFKNSLTDLALQSPFSVAQVQQLGIKLLGVTDSADFTTRALKANINAVIATGGGYGELSRTVTAMMQTFSKSNASAEELNRQFTNANIPAIRLLAESIVKDLDHPMRKYIETAQAAGGASANLSKQFGTASGNLPELEKRIEGANKRLQELKDSGKEGSSTFINAQASLLGYQERLNKAKGTIEAYNTAQATAGQVTKASTLNIKEVMGALQNIGDLKIPGDLVAESLIKAMNEAFGGAAQNNLQTFSAQWQRFTELLQLSAYALLGLDENLNIVSGSLFDRLSGALRTANDYLQPMRAELVKLSASFANSIPFITTLISLFIGILLPGILTFIVPLLTFAAIWGTIGFAIGKAVESMGGWQGALDTVKSKFNELLPIIDNFLFKDIGIAATSWQQLYGRIDAFFFKPFLKNVEQMKDKFVFGDVKSPVPASWGDVLDKVMQKLVAFGQFLQTTFAPSMVPLKKAWEELGPALEKVGQLLQYLLVIGGALIAGFINGLLTGLPFVIILFKGLAEFFLSFFQILHGIFTLNLDLILQGFGNMFSGIWNVAVGFIGAILAAFAGFIQGIIAYFQGLYNVLVGNSIIPDMVNAIIESFTSMINTVIEGISNFINDMIKRWEDFKADVSAKTLQLVTAVIGWFEDMRKKAIDKATEMKNNLVDGFNNMKTSLVTSAQNIASSITSTLGGLAGKAFSWGRDIITNMINGLKDAVRAGGKVAEIMLGKMGISMGDLKFAHGGIVPGPIGAPVPIIAHGGERITPRSGVESGGGMAGGVTINMYGNMSLDSEQRVEELANKIINILGRQNELARYGVGF